MNAFQRVPLFGEHHRGLIKLSSYGEVVQEEWLRSSILRSEIVLDVFTVMPDHFHAIVFFFTDQGRRSIDPVSPEGTRVCRRKPRSLGSLIAGFKASTTKRINLLRCTPGAVVWQNNYHEHVIRNEAELARLRQYVINNPKRRS